MPLTCSRCGAVFPATKGGRCPACTPSAWHDEDLKRRSLFLPVFTILGAVSGLLGAGLSYASTEAEGITMLVWGCLGFMLDCCVSRGRVFLGLSGMAAFFLSGGPALGLFEEFGSFARAMYWPLVVCSGHPLLRAYLEFWQRLVSTD